MRRHLVDVPEEERYAFWEELYASSGFRIWQGNFLDVLMDEAANEEFTEFVANKIRERVDDPVTAEKLVPKDHGFGTRRIPMETNYYEAYNRENVHLVDLNETPIECITETGVRTTEQDYDVDVIVYATGFDAMTGAFDRIDIIGVGGRSCGRSGRRGRSPTSGIVDGRLPQPPDAGRAPGRIRVHQLRPGHRGGGGLVHAAPVLPARPRLHAGSTRRPRPSSTGAATCGTCTTSCSWARSKSWFTGYNSNIEGRDTMRPVAYNGGAPRYRKRLAEVAENGYEGFVLD